MARMTGIIKKGRARRAARITGIIIKKHNQEEQQAQQGSQEFKRGCMQHSFNPRHGSKGMGQRKRHYETTLARPFTLEGTRRQLWKGRETTTYQDSCDKTSSIQSDTVLKGWGKERGIMRQLWKGREITTYQDSCDKTSSIQSDTVLKGWGKERGIMRQLWLVPSLSKEGTSRQLWKGRETTTYQDSCDKTSSIQSDNSEPEKCEQKEAVKSSYDNNKESLMQTYQERCAC